MVTRESESELKKNADKWRAIALDIGRGATVGAFVGSWVGPMQVFVGALGIRAEKFDLPEVVLPNYSKSAVRIGYRIGQGVFWTAAVAFGVYSLLHPEGSREF
jgi:hypothetical protein